MRARNCKAEERGRGIRYLGLQKMLGIPDDPDRADELTEAGNSPSEVAEIRRLRARKDLGTDSESVRSGGRI
jgi:hypothetical protein